MFTAELREVKSMHHQIMTITYLATYLFSLLLAYFIELCQIGFSETTWVAWCARREWTLRSWFWWVCCIIYFINQVEGSTGLRYKWTVLSVATEMFRQNYLEKCNKKWTSGKPNRLPLAFKTCTHDKSSFHNDLVVNVRSFWLIISQILRNLITISVFKPWFSSPLSIEPYHKLMIPGYFLFSVQTSNFFFFVPRCVGRKGNFSPVIITVAITLFSRYTPRHKIDARHSSRWVERCAPNSNVYEIHRK